jgi:hypothetical protein
MTVSKNKFLKIPANRRDFSLTTRLKQTKHNYCRLYW